MVCVDTDFLIDLKDRDPAAGAKMEELRERGEIVFTTAINAAEFYYGANRSQDTRKALAEADKLFGEFTILAMDYPSAKLWGKLAEQMKSNIMGDLDLFIASIALSNNQPLVTRNVAHFERVPELKVESW